MDKKQRLIDKIDMARLAIADINATAIEARVPHEEAIKRYRKELESLKRSGNENGLPVQSGGVLANTLKEAANRTGLSVPYLRTCIDDGSLKVKRFGRAIRILESDLLAFVQNGRPSPMDEAFEFEEAFDIDEAMRIEIEEDETL